MSRVPLRYVATVIAGQSPPNEAVSDLLDGLPFIQGNAEFTAKSPRPRLQCNSAPKRAQAGDLLLSVRAPVGALNWCDGDLGIGRGVAALRSCPGWDRRFVAYGVMASLSDLRARATGSTFEAVTGEQIGSLALPAAPLQEQRRIADFLDDRVARIDQMIAARRRQEELMIERFAVQRNLAIRGGDVSMRSVSGWLGNIAAHWPDRRLGQLVTFHSGAGFPPDAQGEAQGDLPFIKVSDMANSDELRNISDAVNWISNEMAAILGAKAAPAGTIIFPKVGAALLSNSRSVMTRSATFDNNVMGLHFKTGDTRYWLHVLSCIDMGELSNPGPVPSVGREGVAELRVPLPPNPEQSAIGAALDSVLIETKKQRTRIEKSIALLQEYKQSLITAAVTGEFDVTTASTKIPEN